MLAMRHSSTVHVLRELYIYTGIPPMLALIEILEKIIVELLSTSTLSLATKQVKEGRFSEFFFPFSITPDSTQPREICEGLRGEKDVEAVLQRLDRLTLDEPRATAAQTLEVVYNLVRHRKVIMGGERFLPSHYLFDLR